MTTSIRLSTPTFLASLRSLAYELIWSIRCIVTGEDISKFFKSSPHMYPLYQANQKNRQDKQSEKYKKTPRILAMKILWEDIALLPLNLLGLLYSVIVDFITLAMVAVSTVYTGITRLFSSKSKVPGNEEEELKKEEKNNPDITIPTEHPCLYGFLEFRSKNEYNKKNNLRNFLHNIESSDAGNGISPQMLYRNVIVKVHLKKPDINVIVNVQLKKPEV